MKIKIFFILLFLFSASQANPFIITPLIKFSELAFDENGRWEMELFYSFSKTYKDVDSVVIKISGVSSKLNIRLRETDWCYIITSDSLETPIKIDPAKSFSIRIYTYADSGYSSRVYEDYTSSGPMAKYPGCSLCKSTLSNFKNKTEITYISPRPSIGELNNLTALGETLTGHIYDKDGKSVANYSSAPVGPFYFEIHSPLEIKSDGTYTTTVYPTDISPDSISFTQLKVRIPDFNGFLRIQDIKPLKFAYIRPDSVLQADIHLLSNDYILTDVEKNPIDIKKELTLINYPNPFNSSTNFFIEFPSDVKEKNGGINIYNAAGKLVRTLQIKDKTSSIWDGRDLNGAAVSSGVYYYQLIVHGQMLKTGSMILLK